MLMETQDFRQITTLTITAVASQTSVTVSEAITVANNVILLAMADGGEEVNAESIDFQVAGPEFAAAGSAVDYWNCENW